MGMNTVHHHHLHYCWINNSICDDKGYLELPFWGLFSFFCLKFALQVDFSCGVPSLFHFVVIELNRHKFALMFQVLSPQCDRGTLPCSIVVEAASWVIEHSILVCIEAERLIIKNLGGILFVLRQKPCQVSHECLFARFVNKTLRFDLLRQCFEELRRCLVSSCQFQGS